MVLSTWLLQGDEPVMSGSPAAHAMVVAPHCGLGANIECLCAWCKLFNVSTFLGIVAGGSMELASVQALLCIKSPTAFSIPVFWLLS